MASTILATFDNLQNANDAIRDLTEAGFDRSDVGLAVYNRDGTTTSTLPTNGTMTNGTPNVNTYDDDVDGGDGAGVGAIAGSIFGAIVGLATITIPGIGPVIAAGPLAAALGALAGAGIGAVSGAATGGVVASLVNLGVPEAEAHTYAESLRRGAALVSVNVYEVDADRAVFILQKHHPVDLDQRATEWREQGWKGFDPDQTDDVGTDHSTYEPNRDYPVTPQAMGSTSGDVPPVRRYDRPE